MEPYITVMFLQDHNTPLHLAAYNGNTGVVEMLVREGADVEAKNKVS